MFTQKIFQTRAAIWIFMRRECTAIKKYCKESDELIFPAGILSASCTLSPGTTPAMSNPIKQGRE